MKITTARSLASAIRDYRKNQHLTQKEVSERVGMKQATVSGFENNPDNSKLETLFKLLASLELELHISPRNMTISQTSQWKEEW